MEAENNSPKSRRKLSSNPSNEWCTLLCNQYVIRGPYALHHPREVSREKKTSYFPLYWLLRTDPHSDNGL